MPGITLANDLAIQNLQSGEQGGRSMPDIVMGISAAASRLERQARLRSVQRLDLALFIQAENQAFFRWIEIETHHVGQFLQKAHIAGEFESAAQMRLEIVFLPEAVDRVLADALLPRHRPATPMGHAAGLGLQSRRYNPGHFFLPVGGFSPASRLDLPEALQSLFIESSPPERRSVAVDLQLGGDLQILFSLTGQEQNPRAQHHLLRGELGANPFFQLVSVDLRKLYHRSNFRHATNFAQKARYV